MKSSRLKEYKNIKENIKFNDRILRDKYFFSMKKKIIINQ